MIRYFRRCLFRKIVPCGLVAMVIIYLRIVMWTEESEDSKMTNDYIPQKESLRVNLNGFEKNIPNQKAAENWHSDNSQRCFKQNFVFIKCMKCATESMGLILRKIAYNKKLHVMLPRKKNIYLGWPFSMELSDFRSLHPGAKYFNCLIEHAVYNESVMTKYFPPNTEYITIIREPWSHFKSTFAYFNLKEIARVQTDNHITEYLHNLETYETLYKRHDAKKRFCIPDGFSITKNLLSHCLGMPTGFPTGREDVTMDDGKVNEYINKLSKQFSLVMIVEYFHESLVLLKRMMCWSLKDLIYKRVNMGKYHYFTTAEDRLIHRKWSPADYKLYDHFNKTFWMKVKAEGADFYDEVQQFSKIQRHVNKFCNFTYGDKNTTQIQRGGVENVNFTINAQKNLTIPHSLFNEEFVVQQSDCDMMNSDILKLLKEQYNSYVPWKDSEPTAPNRGC